MPAPRVRPRLGGPTSLSCSLSLAAATLLFSVSSAPAQNFPTRALRIVVGFTAGGPTDVPVRFIADKLSAQIGQPVIVENKPGAGSMLATYDLLSRPRDGYTLLACTYFDAVNTLLYKNAKYKVADIAPITLIARYDYAIAEQSKVGSKTSKHSWSRRRPIPASSTTAISA